ncbi:MAG: thiol:disulfide interchange protein DsbA/DsbL [Xanthomonadales bacterium]|nr:thiol:disulfide interchange protein DsbA/DsbL [Xanthomonadales bacterium]
MTRLVFLFVALMSTSVFAQNDGDFKEGLHYTLINDAAATTAGDTVAAYEIFGYLCPHCYSFQPFVTAWEKELPENVEFIRVPAIFSAAWEPLGRAYLTAEMLGVADKGHEDIFTAIHKDKKQIRSIEDAADFYAQYDVDTAKFLSTASSFAVDAKVRKYQALVRKWGVRGTPSLVINGKYLISVSRDVPPPKMIEVANYLIAKELAK